MRRYSVYIMASRRNGTLYIGVTNHLAARALQFNPNWWDLYETLNC